MIVSDNAVAARAELNRLRAGKRVAFVPTMGNLHAGHLHLIEQARAHAERIVASIYVNPLQFGPTEDFLRYPRTPDEDRAALAEAHVDLLFIPSDSEIYPRGPQAQTQVQVPGLSDVLCGASRPGHFRGVTTVVNRLFNLLAPDVAIFGKKDYQQLTIIRFMVSDLGMPIEIIGVDTMREADGLALSSRNQYLSPAERKIAPTLYAALRSLGADLQRGSKIADGEARAVHALASAGLRPDYVSVRRQWDLSPPEKGDRKLVALGAVWAGRTRLIDNIELELPI